MINDLHEFDSKLYLMYWQWEIMCMKTYRFETLQVTKLPLFIKFLRIVNAFC